MPLFFQLIAMGVIVAGLIVYLFSWFRREQKADREVDLSLGFKLGFTGILLIVLFRYLIPIFSQGPSLAAIGGLLILVAVLLCLTMIWARPVIGWLISPLTGILDGGNEVAERVPLMGPILNARSFRNADKALGLIDIELEDFPADFQLNFLKAEILAEDKKDVAAAEQWLRTMDESLELSEGQLCSCWNALAGWYLSVAKDVVQTRRVLEEIADSFPNTLFSEKARTKISRLPTEEAMANSESRAPVAITHHVRDLGLTSMARSGPDPTRDRAEDREVEIARLETEVEINPRDTDARVRLAFLYITFYHDFDLAKGQYDFLLSRPHLSRGEKVKLLDCFAAMQAKGGCTADEIGETLQKIIDLDPRGGAAELARQEMIRIGYRGRQGAA